MQNITYDYAKSVMYQREEGLRRAQLSGTAYEPRRRWRIHWPFRSERAPVYQAPLEA